MGEQHAWVLFHFVGTPSRLAWSLPGPQDPAVALPGGWACGRTSQRGPVSEGSGPESAGESGVGGEMRLARLFH